MRFMHEDSELLALYIIEIRLFFPWNQGVGSNFMFPTEPINHPRLL